MNLIFSQDFDPSTEKVIEWFLYYKKPYTRINYNSDLIETVSFELSDDFSGTFDPKSPKNSINEVIKSFTLSLKSGVTLDLKTITSVWYRKGGMPDYNEFSIDFSVLKSKFFETKAKSYLKTEYNEIVRYIYFYLFQNPFIKTIGSPYLSGSNKPQYLTLAKLFGLNIPHTSIVSKKEELLKALGENAKSITKGISEMVLFSKDYYKLIGYTSEFSTLDVDHFDEVFFPSKIQEKINKIADIRVVFFNGEFFAMAIFSQSNPKTNTDFRNYDSVIPNRNTSFKLPGEIEDKLAKLLAYLSLNFCSLDIILDENYKYYFLEINPVGQFGMVSMPCNYNIEKKLAEYLCL